MQIIKIIKVLLLFTEQMRNTKLLCFKRCFKIKVYIFSQYVFMVRCLYLCKLFIITIASFIKDKNKSRYLGDPLAAPMGTGPLGTAAYTYPYF